MHGRFFGVAEAQSLKIFNGISGNAQKGERQMPVNEKRAREIISGIAQQINFQKKITEIYSRADYQDYQVLLDGEYHCEIREKLVDDYDTFKVDDVRREIVFRLENAEKLEEWDERRYRKSAPADAVDKDHVAVDDKDKYDFM
jgi:hypothetical protein